LFFVYIGTEMSFGFWLAPYAKGAGNAEGMWWATVPSTFIAHCSSGACCSASVQGNLDIRLATRIGAPLGCMGGAALILVHSLLDIAFCAALIGL